nr:hypothetical conserved protein [uncultured crenarchaeote]
MYGPERRGAPVVSFVRISDERVDERGYVRNPYAVAVMDRGLLNLGGVNPLDGLAHGGIVLVNSPEPVTSFQPVGDFRLVFIDVTGAAKKILGSAIVNAGVAAAFCKVLGLGGQGDVVEAVWSELESIGLREELIEKNVELAKVCYEAVPKLGIELTNNQDTPAKIEFASLDYPPETYLPILTSVGNTVKKLTGTWRIDRPIIDYAKCTRCMICYIYCPDSVISLRDDLSPVIDYSNCKGCLICYVMCPPRAIKTEAENVG